MNAELMRELAQPWAITPEALKTIYLMARDGLASFKDRISAEQKAEIDAAMRRRNEPTSGAIAVIPVQGTIRPKRSAMEEMFGMSFGTSLDAFMANYRAAVDDPEVKAIILDMDTPGGAVAGLPEAADEMFKLRGAKKTIAVVNHMAASAGYWLASQADEIVGTPASMTGSIGIITMHQDLTGMAEQMGVKVTLLTAGRFKSEGHPFEPLTDEAKEHTQAMLDQAYDQFVAAVARGRGVSASAVKSGFGEGRVMFAKGALAAGMIDRIGTMRDVLGKFGADTSGMRAEDGEGEPDDQPPIEIAARMRQRYALLRRS